MRATVAAAGALVLTLAGSALPHSLLLESSPAADALLAAPPSEISLRFNNRIEKKLSTIRLVDERGGEFLLGIGRGRGQGQGRGGEDRFPEHGMPPFKEASG